MDDVDWTDSTLWGDQGFIYLISDGRYHKIGQAFNVQKRLKELQTGASEELRIAWTIRSLSIHRTERYLHRKFHPKKTRKKGEWFDLSLDDITWLTTIDARHLDILALRGMVCLRCGAQNRQKCTCIPVAPPPTTPALKRRQFVHNRMQTDDGKTLERCRHCGNWFNSHGSEYVYCYGCRALGNELDMLLARQS